MFICTHTYINTYTNIYSKMNRSAKDFKFSIYLYSTHISIISF